MVIVVEVEEGVVFDILPLQKNGDGLTDSLLLWDMLYRRLECYIEVFATLVNILVAEVILVGAKDAFFI